MTETLVRTPDIDRGDGGFTLRQSINPRSRTWYDAIPVEYEVFKDSGYVASLEEMQDTYAPYEEDTIMASVYQEGISIGEVRIINYNPDRGFKTGNDIADGKLTITEEGEELLGAIDPTNMFEVATIGLDPAYRTKPGDPNHPISQLYGMIYTYGRDNNLRYIIASFDERYLGRFGAMYGDALTRLGPPKKMMGSPTIPVLIDLEHMHDVLKSMGAEEFENTLLAIGRGAEVDD